MSDRDERLLREMLFGEGSFARQGAPEPELLAELAEVLPQPGLTRALFTLAGIGVLTSEVRAGALGRVVASALRKAPGITEPSLLARSPKLIRYIPDEDLDGLLGLAEEIDASDLHRREVMLELGRRLPPERGAELLRREAVLATRELLGGRGEARDLVRILQELPEPFQDEAAEELLSLVEASAPSKWQILALAALLPNLASEQRGKALKRLLGWLRSEPASSQARARVLAEIGVALPEADRELLAEETLEALAPEETPERLLGVALYCSPARRHQFMEDLLARYAADSVIWPSPGERLAREAALLAWRLPGAAGQAMREIVEPLEVPKELAFELAPYMSEAQIEAAIPRLTDELGWHRPDHSLATLAPHLSSKAHLGLLEQIAAWSAPDRERALALMELAPYLSPELEGMAAWVAGTLKESWWRERALGAVESPRELTHGSSVGTTRAEEAEVSRDRLRRLFGSLPEERQVAVFDDTVRAIWDQYGGSAPPQQPPEETTEERASAEHSGLAYGDAEHEAETETDDGEHKAARGPIPPANEQIHFVNRGFASWHKPDIEHDPFLPLQPGSTEFFWLEIADRRLRGDLGAEPATIRKDLLPERSRIVVALFAFEREIGITPGQDVGELEVGDDGHVRVIRSAAEPDELEDRTLLERRLFFPVRVPQGREAARLRCNLYCKGVLVQSHLVTARLATPSLVLEGGVERGGITPEIADLLHAEGAVPDQMGIDAVVDYTLSHSLRAKPMVALPAHRLSILMNTNGDGSHSFHFFGGEGGQSLKESPTIGAQELATLVEEARSAMRQVAWNGKEPWSGELFRYASRVDIKTLTTDLARLAKAGRRIFSALNDALAGGGGVSAEEAAERRRRLRELTARTGLLQLASKDSATELIPAAILHDQRIDAANRNSEDFSLCPEFRGALRAGGSILETRCFQGDCPTAADGGVVCPSGFWGYRHQLGMPLSLPEEGDTVATEITYSGAPRLVVAKWTGKDFLLRQAHETTLAGLHPGWEWEGATDGEQLERVLVAGPHVVYFYCHGGLHDRLPYLQIGSEAETYRIDLTLVEDLSEFKHLFWSSPRPLIFLNGCHTTALKPGDPFNLVTPFIQKTNAAGVIGTEITIFEPLAVRFAEEFLRRFLESVPLGEAVRQSRIALLAEHNPLGLVYIPFALGGLTMREETSGSDASRVP